MIHVYGCATPIRMHVARAMATYLKAPLHEESNPGYYGDDSVVWGLIRGAPRVIEATKDAGCNYYQMDNAYFGRNAYYRFTKNAFQMTELKERTPQRWEFIARQHSLQIRPWKQGKKVIFALSTEHLYKFFGLDVNVYRERYLYKIKKHTDREVIVRDKHAKHPIENDLQDAWCLVTHSSAAALDALMWGVPVFTTGPCAANPCASQDLSLLETPVMPEREPLFWSLAHGQFLPEEMQLGLAWKTISESS